jgi:filamentous hemagglutinin family protein
MKPALFPLMPIGILAFGYLYATSEIANAQVTSDGTVNTQVNQTDNVSEITGGETRGDNLFHSFQEFSVRPGNQAFFNNAAAIKNIFSRVTAGNVSNIDGLIRANGSASLFLINPAGIIFGEGARLDIGGSFYGSSADSILFEDGKFSATDLDNPPVLTINAPIGLGFRDNPEDIANNSLENGLEVATGNNLTLLGGDVSFNGGRITAPVGRVELGGLSLAGTIGFNNDGSLSFPEGVARGNVFFNQEAFVDVSGAEGGNLTVNANNLEISGDSLLQGGTFASTGIADGQSGDIILNATGEIKIDSSTIDNAVEIGNGGALNITTPNLALTNGGEISADTLGQGDGGTINIDATESVTLDGTSADGNFSSAIFNTVQEGAVGNGGEINIIAPNLFLTNGGLIAAETRGRGNAGNLNINIFDSLEVEGMNYSHQALAWNEFLASLGAALPWSFVLGRVLRSLH